MQCSHQEREWRRDVAEGSIRERILKCDELVYRLVRDASVAEGSIRERILKFSEGDYDYRIYHSCRGLDPREDTEILTVRRDGTRFG